MQIRPAREDELSFLSALCLRSKGHWGYSAEFLAACRNELTLTPSELESTTIAVAERDGRPVGLMQINVIDGVCDLLKLFVEPAEIGKGCGAALFSWAVDEARRRGATMMTIEADPDAEPFYRKMGARIVGAVPSGSIPGRVLPLLELPLTDMPRPE